MTTLHVTATPNIESSLNAHFAEHLGAIETPSYLAPLRINSQTVRVVLDMPEVTLATPCFSFFHIGGGVSTVYQGSLETQDTTVGRAYGQIDISAWVKRDDLINNQRVWMAQLRYMQEMVNQVFLTWPNVPVKNYMNTPDYPLDTEYLVRLQNFSVVQTAPDPNPALERRRMLIAYWWHSRQHRA